MSYENSQRRVEQQIKRYKAKSGASSVTGMYSRFDPNINLSGLSFAWQLDLAIKINIDIEIILNPINKAKYGSAIYGTSVYDPITVLGVLTANSLTKWLMLHMVRRFLPANERGYKYAMQESLYWLNAEIPMLETVAPEPVWFTRARKIDATRNWTAFYDMSFYDVNAYPTEALYGGYDLCQYEETYYTDDELTESAVLIRFSDFLRCVWDCTDYMGSYVDAVRNDLWKTNGIFSILKNQDVISANFYDTARYDRAPYSGVPMPYPELYILSPNLVAYMPVYDVANYDYDVYYTTVEFDEDLVNSIVENARTVQQPIYRELLQFTGSERMHSLYETHARFQGERQYKIKKILADANVPRINNGLYNAFMMEYTYKKMAEGLVDKETVIQRYIRLGLNETVLRAIALMSSRR